MQTEFIIASRDTHAEIDRLNSIFDALIYVDAVRTHGWIGIDGPPPEELGVFCVILRADGSEELLGDADLAALVDE